MICLGHCWGKEVAIERKWQSEVLNVGQRVNGVLRLLRQLAKAQHKSIACTVVETQAEELNSSHILGHDYFF